MTNKKKKELKNIENTLAETLKMIIELMNNLKNHHYYLITCSINFTFYHITLQRTEFSKTKYINFIPCTIVEGPGRLIECYNYNTEKCDTMWYEHEYTNDELYKELIPLELAAEHRLSIFYDMFPEYLEKIEEEKPKPVKPSGNPFAGENWKNRKHQFKGGK